MNDGYFLPLDFNNGELSHEAITASSWPGLQNYKNRIITAVQNDRTFADSYYCTFLTNNEYITYNILKNETASGPGALDNVTWPGLLRD